MSVKIVTDSSCDLPAKIIQEMGITVVPLYIRFGNEVFKDRIDISEDVFYQRLQKDSIHPSTIQPSPQDFATAYKQVCAKADGMVSLHISSKLSGTYNSAVQGRDMLEPRCPVEIIDSGLLSMALGIICVSAARTAAAGKNLADVIAEARAAIAETHLLGLLDTLKYLALGGRIGKAKALLGSVLSVKPILTLKDGEVVPAGQVRSRSKGIDRLYEFVKSASEIKELSIIYNTTPDEAEALAERIAPIFPKEKIIISRIGPMLGVHLGPRSMMVAYRGK